MIRTPTGLMPEAQVLAIFEQVGFTPPPGTSTQDAFLMLLELARQEEEKRLKKERLAEASKLREAEKLKRAEEARQKVSY